jgi:hypothetical protein
VLAEPAATIEAPAHNGFTVLPTLSSLGDHDQSTSERLHDALMPHPEAEAEPATDPAPVEEPAPAVHSMPTLGSLTPLASLTSLTTPAEPTTPSEPTTPNTNGTAASDFFSSLESSPVLGNAAAPSTTEYQSFEPGPAPAGLPKLASAPISMDELVAIDAAGADASGPWNGATHNLAAVEIWEMIDSLDGPAPSDDQLVTSGTEKRRGWLRGRKG